MLAIQPSAKVSSAMKSSWPHLDANTVMKRIYELRSNPDLLDQKGLGLCGQATFYHHFIQRSPWQFGAMGRVLFEDAIGFIGDLTVEPHSDVLQLRDLVDVNYSNLVTTYGTANIPDQADWMLLCSLRDSQNRFFDYQGAPVDPSSSSYIDVWAEETVIDEAVEWYRKSGLYRSVTWDQNPDLTHLAEVLVKDDSTHIALCIDAGMLIPKTGGHMISMEGTIEIFPSEDCVTLHYWSWGEPTTSVNLTLAKFTSNYKSAIIAKF